MNVVTTLHGAQQFDAFSGVSRGDLASPLAIAARKLLLHRRLHRRQGEHGWLTDLQEFFFARGRVFQQLYKRGHWFASRGLGAIPSAARSATCLGILLARRFSSLSLS